ncbi:MAG TPA: PH domain-containing protein [Candidatus Dormibacteraeota bacterium]|jgi:membrane protein YdbS with pleckstrin-like domain|nr:PH domain-containing protein [Candidatus Dormibacteraeota bacterium]
MPEPFVDGERPIVIARQHIAIFIPYALVCVAALAVGLGVLQLFDATLLLFIAVLGRLMLQWSRYQKDPDQPWHHFGRHFVFWAAVFAAGYGLLHVFRFPAWLVMVLVVAVLLAFRLLQWHYQTYTLTNQRVITEYGVLNRVSESLGIEKIQHTTLSRGVTARFFGYGDIVIRSAGKGEELMKHIADADSFSIALVTAMSGSREKAGIVERFVAPSYEPDSGYAPPLGWGG